jgi:hypothetical protein
VADYVPSFEDIDGAAAADSDSEDSSTASNDALSKAMQLMRCESIVSKERGHLHEI